jgi:hypothetical protein
MRDCAWYPDCSCFTKFNHWADRFLQWEWDPPDAEELQWAITDCYFMFACLAVRCPNRAIKKIAKYQLGRPLFMKEAEKDGFKPNS